MREESLLFDLLCQYVLYTIILTLGCCVLIEPYLIVLVTCLLYIPGHLVCWELAIVWSLMKAKSSLDHPFVSLALLLSSGRLWKLLFGLLLAVDKKNFLRRLSTRLHSVMLQVCIFSVEANNYVSSLVKYYSFYSGILSHPMEFNYQLSLSLSLFS